MKKNKKMIAAVSALALIVVASSITAFGSSTTAASEEDKPIVEAAAAMGDIQTTIENSGALELDDTISISLPSTIEVLEVHVAQGDKVESGTLLATLDEISVKSTYYTLEETLEELEDEQDDYDDDESEYYALERDILEVEEALEEVEPLMETFTLVASESGEVASIQGSSSEEEQESAEEATGGAQTTPNTTMGGQYNLMSYTSTSYTLMSATPTGGESVLEEGTTSSDATTPPPTDEAIPEEGTATDPISLAGPLALEVTTPVVGETPMAALATSPYYTSTLVWSTADATFLANTVYQVKIELVATAGYIFTNNITPTVGSATITEFTVTNDQGGSKLSFIATFPATNETPSGSSHPEGETQPEGTVPQGGTGQSQGGGGTTQIQGGSMSGSTGTSGGSIEQTTTEETAEEALVSYTEVLTMQGSTQMLARMNLDEMDILLVEVGQVVYVNIEALGIEDLEAKVSDIDYTGVNEGGTTKYTVEIAMERQEGMLSGMSLSASIVVAEINGVLTIPSMAIFNEGIESYVYTSYDEEADELTGKTKIVTGVSDGNLVEILEGLGENTAIYYR